MAAFYVATHRNWKRVTIKMLHRELSSDADLRSRFLREGYFGNQIDHPSVASVLDEGVAEDGTPYLVLEPLDGETLEAHWERVGKRLSLKEATAIVDQLLDLLAAAHQAGVVHGNLGPQSVFVGPSGAIKVVALGLAALYERPISHDPLAPEAAQNQWDDVDARTDLWAVGATLALLAGGHAFDLSALPPAVAEVVRRALAVDKQERWPDAFAMREALRQGVALGLGPSSVPEERIAQGLAAAHEIDANEELDWAPAIGRRRSRHIALVGAVGAVAILAPVVLLYWHSKTAAQEPQAAKTPAPVVAVAAPVPSPKVEQIVAQPPPPKDAPKLAQVAQVASPKPTPAPEPSISPMHEKKRKARARPSTVDRSTPGSASHAPTPSPKTEQDLYDSRQ
jgi:serine/threonine-protein kinase